MPVPKGCVAPKFTEVTLRAVPSDNDEPLMVTLTPVVAVWSATAEPPLEVTDKTPPGYTSTVCSNSVAGCTIIAGSLPGIS